MYFYEYGDSSLPKVVLLHPLGLPGTALYEAAAAHVQNEYCFVVADEGGHGKAGAYVSLEDEVASLTTYLIEHGHTEIDLLYGASMGTSVAYELMKNPAFTIRRIWLDSPNLAKKSSFIIEIMRIQFLKIRHKAIKNPDAPIEKLMNDYGPRFEPSMRPCFAALSREDIKLVCHDYAHRDLVVLPDEMIRNTHIEWGSGDPNYKLSAESLEEYFDGAELVIREGHSHCTYMARCTAEYVAELEEFIKGK